jgi:hypothetical protein
VRVFDWQLGGCRHNSDRVAAKFVENEFEKADRLMELFFQYQRSMRAALKRIKQWEDMEPDEMDSELRGAGQFMLQQVSSALTRHQTRDSLCAVFRWCRQGLALLQHLQHGAVHACSNMWHCVQTSIIFGYLWATGDVLLRKRLLMLLHQQKASLGAVRAPLEALYSEIIQQVEVRSPVVFCSCAPSVAGRAGYPRWASIHTPERPHSHLHSCVYFVQLGGLRWRSDRVQGPGKIWSPTITGIMELSHACTHMPTSRAACAVQGSANCNGDKAGAYQSSNQNVRRWRCAAGCALARSSRQACQDHRNDGRRGGGTKAGMRPSSDPRLAAWRGYG